ncbi:MAG: hypothetical protein DIZ80_07440 [endosymbiont of Galathealinum brachiosum]|uniref:DUF4412 domain-containing protein n=1 Tax=endosymbiont of Galathealinum brachiosum TaxID=2200906 RepID=A0A370DGB6_9GAMM|nr:MAG: hypothetical protein DIZ80_07440 [endosymbiont of Galathealinum brachiosum]
MKKLSLLSALLISVFINNTIQAAVAIQTRDSQHQVSTIYIDGNKARIEMPQNEGYVVMDLASKTMNVVIHRHRTVMDMSEFLLDNGRNSAPTKYVDTYTKTMGLGPTIAGYETEEYALYANDNYCGSLYVSVEAMRDMGVKKFAYAFANMEKNMDAKLAGMTGMGIDAFTEPCDEADRKMSLRLREIGFPLKSIDQNKRLESVVTRINKKARLPVNAFKIPADYKLTNTSEMINDAMKQMQKMQPQMQEMMKNMTPEQRQMMQQYTR